MGIVEEAEQLYKDKKTEVEKEARWCPKLDRPCFPECALFVRNGCSIFHIACAMIEWEKVLRRGGNV